MFDHQPEASFEELGLGARLVSSLRALGFERPTPIQREAIPVLLEGRDLLGQAATGTGKTAAFALPILERLTPAERPGRPSALVLAPTRELASQVAEAIHSYGDQQGVVVLPLYGGQPIHRQLQALRDPVDIVVATPGRAVDHLDRGTLSLDEVSTVVLDEADEMLDMGFADELEAILSRAPSERQTVLFSATMPRHMAEVAQRHLRDPIRIRVAREPESAGEAPRVREEAWLVRREQKVDALLRLIAWEQPAAALLFCHTRADVDLVSQELESRGHRVEALHGGMSQERREQVLRRLRDGASKLLVATDVAARGLDVDVLSHVVNVDLPSSPEVYTHRVGRVGRAGREGVAVSLVEPRQRRTLAIIERVARRRLARSYVPDDEAIAARRREQLADRVRAAAEHPPTDAVRALFDSLREGFEPEALALAALSLVFEGTPAPPPPAAQVVTPPRPEPTGWEPADRKPRPRREQRGGPRVVRLWIGAGRNVGLRPGDLVGAITGEAGVNGRSVGAIRIGERSTIVEIDERHVEGVLDALNRATLRGKKVKARRDRTDHS